jgi:hypothetical protein
MALRCWPGRTQTRGVSGSAESRAEVLLGGRLGRAALADLAGLNTLMLLAADGKPPPEGVAFLTSSSSSGLSARLRRPLRPHRAHRDAGTWPERVNPGENDAAAVIGTAVASAVQASAEQPWFTDPPALLASVARAAEQWEPSLPGGQAELLRPLAEAVASAPAASWWWEPTDLRHQRWVGCDHRRMLTRGSNVARAVEAAEEDAAAEEEAMARDWALTARRRRRGSAEVAVSGTWWSGPLGGTVWTSRGNIGDLPAVELACAEDPLGEEEFEVWAVEIDPFARVYEVHEPGDWGQLAATHPRDVTASRWYDWSRWTGREGRWILPDWRSVATQWDGVHVSVAGYLSTARMAVDIGGGAATLLAGWDADQTLWLRDVFTDTQRLTTWHGTPGPEALS